MTKGVAKLRGRKWRDKIRPYVLARDGYRCQLRIPGTWVTRTGVEQHCLGQADCVHHTLGVKVTANDTRYLKAACTPCNLKVGDPTKQPDPPPRPLTRW